jgi:hypothetical protein
LQKIASNDMQADRLAAAHGKACLEDDDCENANPIWRILRWDLHDQPVMAVAQVVYETMVI